MILNLKFLKLNLKNTEKKSRKTKEKKNHNKLLQKKKKKITKKNGKRTLNYVTNEKYLTLMKLLMLIVIKKER